MITDFLLNLTWAIVLTAVTGLWFATFWALLPFARRNWADDDDEDDDVAYAEESNEAVLPSPR